MHYTALSHSLVVSQDWIRKRTQDIDGEAFYRSIVDFLSIIRGQQSTDQVLGSLLTHPPEFYQAYLGFREYSSPHVLHEMMHALEKESSSGILQSHPAIRVAHSFPPNLDLLQNLDAVTAPLLSPSTLISFESHVVRFHRWLLEDQGLLAKWVKLVQQRVVAQL